MSGLVPDPIAGAVQVADATGQATGALPQPGLFTGYGTSFRVTGGLYYLQAPGPFGTCGGRVTSVQMNFVESELFALAQAFDPQYIWDTLRGNNIATAFAAIGAGSESVDVTDVFDNPIGRMLAKD